ncbi:hypothetical protein M23134_05332 [Microscilla marina ATCC 23134]|uniref:Uncharacterized protein n=2 Tax=Microscilla marina TaxID=1027 RepID=A1ZHJ2_MICM2|nr:hypothetical protein M23134_05332 [Microscilla marina ATCC 23134]
MYCETMEQQSPITIDTMSKGKKKNKVNPELEGLNVEVDTFGEIKFNYNIDKINEFLDKNVDDKKLNKKPKGENTDDDKH